MPTSAVHQKQSVKNGLLLQRAKNGTRPREPADQRYKNADLFGAIFPKRGVGAALPIAITEVMQMHLDKIRRPIALKALAKPCFVFESYLDRKSLTEQDTRFADATLQNPGCPPTLRMVIFDSFPFKLFEF